jgi:hypothetical protein
LQNYNNGNEESEDRNLYRSGKVTNLQEGKWLIFGLVTLLVLLLIAWRMAISLNERTQLASRHATVISHASRESSVQVTSGQLIAEIPERKEKWALKFSASHYDTEKQVATTKEGVCQVTRNEQLVTVFYAPTIIVRFKEREMEMKGGVTIIAMLPRLKVQLETLKWHWETGQLIGTGMVKFEGEQATGTADGLEGDITLQRVSLIGNIHINWSTLSGERK